MADDWTAKLETYLDGELSASEMRDLDAHVRSCPSCAADVLSQLQLKRAVHSAGKRYIPSSEFRERIRKSVATKPRRSPIRMWLGATAAVALLLVAGLVSWSGRQQQMQRQQVFSELADLHVATLASANPVDVISTDRHTVKPWFQGKIPFTFNLPELQNSEFTLLGGRVTYLGQTPGAELIYQIRKHQISVFIFPDRAVGRELGSSSKSQKELSFNIESWDQDGLRYFVIGDANSNDLRSLADLLKKAS
ncbi:MAG TPA: anti-sigma factor [Terriglobales bacterium]|jgi:anti-sigma factor RsiW|nr:anti-sigma factor [Terriglobales bacterium]